jgi:type IV secretion system protein VirB10
MIRLPWRKALSLNAGEAHAQDSSGEEQAGTRNRSFAQPSVAGESAVRGERAGLIASGARSLQSRMTSLLAAGLMVSVGAGMLAWYYLDALSRPAAARAPAQASLPEGAGEGMTLPPFGSNAAAAQRSAALAASAPSAARGAVSASSIGSPAPPAANLAAALLPDPPLNRAPGSLPRGYGAPAHPSARREALDRRLSGEVFAGGGSGPSSSLAAVSSNDAQARTEVSGLRGDALETLLRPSVPSLTRARVLPTQRLLLPKGAFIDCTLETAIDSTLPGMTTCVTATDTFGADGTVVLLERGTKLIGETRGQVRQGEARVFVVWTEARTPTGVVVQLDSPGTDALGRSGLEGKVNRHFWQRFGAAALVSTIGGAVQAEVQSSARGGTVILDPTASEDVVTEVLRGTLDIPPTIRVRNGARIQVLVARDVDFRQVYELELR